MVQLLTVRDVAQRLKVHERSVRRLIASGQLPAVKLGEGRTSPVRVDEAELRSWLYGQPDDADRAA
jgi:excisionase family DNA binding protein